LSDANGRQYHIQPILKLGDYRFVTERVQQEYPIVRRVVPNARRWLNPARRLQIRAGK